MSSWMNLKTKLLYYSENMVKTILLRSSLLSLGLFFRYLVPLQPEYGGVHDDRLVVNLAINILDGNWLGTWENSGNRILAKGPGYSFFLYLGHFLPWSQVMTNYLLIMLGVCIFSIRLDSITGRKFFGNLLFILVVLNPVFYGEQFSRLYRDPFLGSLYLLFVVLSIELFIWIQKLKYEYEIIKIYTIVMILGSIVSIIILTKNTGQLIICLFIIILSLLIYNLLRQIKLKAIIGVILISLISIMAPLLIVINQNVREYNVKLIDDFSYGAFNDVLTNWARVGGGSDKDFTVIDKTMRNEVYRVSATAKKLEPFLENNRGKVDWVNYNCENKIHCDEAGAWFPWDLRDAVVESGLVNDLKSFQLVFAQINEDITQGCKTGELNCGGIFPSVMTKSFDKVSIRRFVNTFFQGLNHIINITSVGNAIYVSGENPDRKSWSRVINGLPSETDYPEYRSSDLTLNYLTSTLLILYKYIWIGIIILFFVNLPIRIANYTSLRNKPLDYMWSNIFLITLFNMVALTYLQVSNGLYMDAGGVYLTALYPILCVLGVIEIEYFMRITRSKIQSNRAVDL